MNKESLGSTHHANTEKKTLRISVAIPEFDTKFRFENNYYLKILLFKLFSEQV